MPAGRPRACGAPAGAVFAMRSSAPCSRRGPRSRGSALGSLRRSLRV
ncbi:hypothetical protein ACFSM7_15180 [Clavibacter michiganensis subsp. tessellarius]